MKITSLEVKNFKGQKMAQFSFNDKVSIVGDNYTGKTSIAEAIVFALYGINLAGSSRTDSLINQEAKKAEVTICFESNDGEYEVRREATRQKKVFLNGVAASQKDVDPFVGPSDRFMAAFLPTFVIGMKDKDARDFFMKFVKRLKPETVLDQLDTFAGFIKDLDLRDPETRKKEHNANVKELEKDMDYIDGSIATHEQTLNEEVPAKVGTDEIDKQLSDIENDIFSAKKPDLIDTSEIESKIEELQSRLTNNTPELPESRETSEIDEQLADIRAEYKFAKSQEEQLKVPFNIGDNCQTCKQKVDERAHEVLQQEVDKQLEELDQRMLKLMDRGKQLKAQLDEIKASNEADQAFYEVQKEEFVDDIQSQIDHWKSELAKAREKNQKAQQDVSVDPELLGKRKQLNDQLQNAKEINQTVELTLQRKEKAKVEIGNLKAHKVQNQENIDDSKQKIEALNQFIAKQAEMQSEQIGQHFNHASIKLFEITKTTGEIKPAFKLMYDGKTISVLSMSEGIRLGLEVAGMIKKVTGVEYPTFIDNAESITRFDEIPGQLFTATVAEGKELEVA